MDVSHKNALGFQAKWAREPENALADKGASYPWFMRCTAHVYYRGWTAMQASECTVGGGATGAAPGDGGAVALTVH